jgi:hypothetical protein
MDARALKAECSASWPRTRTSARAAREAMQIPATAKAITAESPPPTPRVPGPRVARRQGRRPARAAAVRGGGGVGYLSVRARSPSLSPLQRQPSTASPSA